MQSLPIHKMSGAWTAPTGGLSDRFCLSIVLAVGRERHASGFKAVWRDDEHLALCLDRDMAAPNAYVAKSMTVETIRGRRTVEIELTCSAKAANDPGKK